MVIHFSSLSVIQSSSNFLLTRWAMHLWQLTENRQFLTKVCFTCPATGLLEHLSWFLCAYVSILSFGLKAVFVRKCRFQSGSDVFKATTWTFFRWMMIFSSSCQIFLALWLTRACSMEFFLITNPTYLDNAILALKIFALLLTNSIPVFISKSSRQNSRRGF